MPKNEKPPVAVEESEDLNVLDSEQAGDVSALNIYQRMHRAASMISVLVKKNTCGSGSYGFKYVSHDDTVAKVRLAFQPCGILAIMSIVDSDLTIERVSKQSNGTTVEQLNFIAKVTAEMTFVNVDRPEDRFSVSIPSYAIDNSDKAMGKAISYAKKYGMIALSGLMLATGQDVDQDHIEMRRLYDQKEAQDAPQGARGATASNDAARPVQNRATAQQAAPARMRDDADAVITAIEQADTMEAVKTIFAAFYARREEYIATDCMKITAAKDKAKARLESPAPPAGNKWDEDSAPFEVSK